MRLDKSEGAQVGCRQRLTAARGGNGMGKSMKNVAAVAMLAFAVSGASSFAADLKAPPPAPPPSAWDFAFGSARVDAG